MHANSSWEYMMAITCLSYVSIGLSFSSKHCCEKIMVYMYSKTWLSNNKISGNRWKSIPRDSLLMCFSIVLLRYRTSWHNWYKALVSLAQCLLNCLKTDLDTCIIIKRDGDEKFIKRGRKLQFIQSAFLLCQRLGGTTQRADSSFCVQYYFGLDCSYGKCADTFCSSQGNFASFADQTLTPQSFSKRPLSWCNLWAPGCCILDVRGVQAMEHVSPYTWFHFYIYLHFGSGVVADSNVYKRGQTSCAYFGP